MLTPLDDYLAHQIPEAFDAVGTTDRNFFDRYYFNCHDLGGKVFMVFGMGVYPNLNVIDAFVSIVYEGKQHVIRTSRLLNGDRKNTAVGPLSVEVIEGLRTLRLRCEPADPGITFDITFTGVAFPHEEPRFLRRSGSRTVMDYLRMTQCGRWSGFLEVAGDRFELNPREWWGARDHSWGIRRVGEPEPAGAAAALNEPQQFFWEWSPQQYDDRCLMYSLNEYADGKRWHQSAAIVYPYGDPRQPELYDVRHSETLAPGSRRLQSVRLELTDGAGTDLKIAAEPLSMVYMSGIGYGPPWRHGYYQGELAVEGEIWDLGDAATIKRISGLTETLCRFRMGDTVGYGVFEFLCIGPYLPLGLETGQSVAPL